MLKNLTFLFILFILSSFRPCHSQSQLDSCIANLKSSDYGLVLQARKIISTKYQKESIQKLIALLQDTGYVKLSNTADLIYPGADQDFSHGGYLDYDIDWISVRAAWILEEDTFQDFGYSGKPTIIEKGLIAIKKDSIDNYWKTKLDFSDTAAIAILMKQRKILANVVLKWWQTNETSWTKLNAIKEALTSHDKYRESLALEYLFYPDYAYLPKDRIIINNWYPILKPLVLKIKRSNSVNKKRAKQLLSHMEYVKKGGSF